MWALFQPIFQHRLETRGFDAALRGSPEELLAWEDAQAHEALAEAKEALAAAAKAAEAVEAREEEDEEECEEGDREEGDERAPTESSERGEYS